MVYGLFEMWDFVGTLMPQKIDPCILRDPFAGGRGEAEGEGFCGMFFSPFPVLFENFKMIHSTDNIISHLDFFHALFGFRTYRHASRPSCFVWIQDT
jgi:hypothetical protein